MEKDWTDRDALGVQDLWGLGHNHLKIFQGFATLGSMTRGLGLEIQWNQFHEKMPKFGVLSERKRSSPDLLNSD